jgi:hypothetical protein
MVSVVHNYILDHEHHMPFSRSRDLINQGKGPNDKMR